MTNSSVQDSVVRKELSVQSSQPDSAVSLRGVGKVFETPAGKLRVLDGVDADLPAGAFTAICGASGSGKSTLLNLLTAVDRPTEGEIRVGGVSLGDLSENEAARWRGRNIGIVFQFFQLLPTLTVLENVILPMELCRILPPASWKKRALDLLERVGLVDKAGKFPFALSGGEQQRVAVARALANDPAIVAADEPTGNLDAVNAGLVFDLLTGLGAEGKTVVMVTHNSDFARRSDCLVELVDGRIHSISGRIHSISGRVATKAVGAIERAAVATEVRA